MITKSDIETAIGKKTAVSLEMQTAMETWCRLFLGQKEKEQKTGLHLPNNICTEFTRLIFAESRLKISGETPRAAFLQEQLHQLLPLLQTKIGIGLALGGMVLKPVFTNGEIMIDTIRADCMFPIAFSASGLIQSVVFLEQSTEQDITFTRLEYHTFDRMQKQHTICHYTFKSHDPYTLGTPCELSNTPWKDIEPITVIAAEQPLFGYFKVPKSNHIDPDSPLGVSVYATAIPQILQADQLWHTILWEYQSKETLIFATQDLFNRKNRLSEHEKRLFKLLMHTDSNALITPYSPDIRDDSLFNGLNRILRQIEFSCHFAYGTLSEPTVVEKTATEIKQSKQRSYIFVAALQQQMQTALQHLLYAIDKLASYHNLTPEGEFEFVCDWGDSVLEDVGEEHQRELQMVQAGALKPEIMLMHYYRCNEEEARKMMPKQADAESFSLYGGEY